MEMRRDIVKEILALICFSREVHFLDAVDTK
jgi:hypothetical protein